ncbi:DUF302 domain-containing protein [Nitratifractor sp.]
MKRSITAILSTGALILGGCSGTPSERGVFLKEFVSDYNLSETARRFVGALSNKNYHQVAVVDHEAAATKLKLYLRPNLTVELDNPKISSKLLSCNPTMATDLPLRIGVYRELNGTVRLVYTNPEYWSLKHNIKDATCIQLINLLARDFDAASDAIRKGR